MSLARRWRCGTRRTHSGHVLPTAEPSSSALRGRSKTLARQRTTRMDRVDEATESSRIFALTRDPGEPDAGPARPRGDESPRCEDGKPAESGSHSDLDQREPASAGFPYLQPGASAPGAGGWRGVAEPLRKSGMTHVVVLARRRGGAAFSGRCGRCRAAAEPARTAARGEWSVRAETAPQRPAVAPSRGRHLHAAHPRCRLLRSKYFSATDRTRGQGEPRRCSIFL